VVALDKATGKTVWQSGQYAPAEHSSAIHVVYKGVSMIINGSRKGLLAKSGTTGELSSISGV
jgi:outer membrane protein assembly factor BamB